MKMLLLGVAFLGCRVFRRWVEDLVAEVVAVPKLKCSVARLRGQHDRHMSIPDPYINLLNGTRVMENKMETTIMGLYRV